MTKPLIRITEGLRVRDYDHNQYVVEVKALENSGKKDHWVPAAYVASGPKSLIKRTYENFELEFIREAIIKAKKAWDERGWEDILNELPKKPDGKK